MKLLIFISSLAGGGAERVTVNLANHWSAQGWEVTVVTLAPQREDSYALSPAVKRVSLELRGTSSNALIGLVQNLRRAIALRRLLRDIQPGVALAMMASTNVLLALASWGMNEILTIGSERTYPPQYPLDRMWEWLRKHSYGCLGAVIVQTSKGALWIESNTSARNVAVIPNPVNWPLQSTLPHLAVRDDDCMGKLLLAVGRLSSEKQFSLLIDCFQSLANRHPDWNLVIVGDGPLREALAAQVLAAGLERRVFLPGRAGNVGDWYARADLYVMSSRVEGFPNTLAEALTYGVPAVSFDCDTGPRDIIRHEVDGLLVPADDVGSLATALHRLMGNSALRRRFADRAVEARERFTVERIAGMWEELFEEMGK